MKIELKGVAGILAAIVTVIGGGFYVVHRRGDFQEQALTQARQYIELELGRRFLQKTAGRYPTRDEIESSKEFEIVDTRFPLYPRERAYARFDVRTAGGEETFDLLFRRRHRKWTLEREGAPLFSLR